MLIRPLGPDDASAFRQLRVRALRDHPEAFGRTPEEVDVVEVLAERFRQDLGSDFDFILGAFDGDALVGAAGCHRERAAKHRHVGYIWGMCPPYPMSIGPTCIGSPSSAGVSSPGDHMQ